MRSKPSKPEVDQGEPQPTGYVDNKYKTHSGMLPQSQALEVADADTARVATKRSATRRKPKLVANIPEGSEPKGSVTRPVRANFWRNRCLFLY